MPAKSFRIRRTTDKRTIKRLHKKLFNGDRFYDEYFAAWVVENAKGKVVGFCLLGEWSPGVAFLARAGLLEKARGQGLHKRLIRVRERLARQLGYESMSTYTAIESVSSSLNLERAGYRLYTPNDAPFPGNWLYWTKELLQSKGTNDDGTTNTPDDGTTATTADRPHPAPSDAE